MTTPTPPPADLEEFSLDAPPSGHPGNAARGWSERGAQVWEPDQGDSNWELRHPRAARVYNTMRDTETRIAEVLSIVYLSILGGVWDLETEGVSAEVVDAVRQSIGLPAPGAAEPASPRGEAGVRWLEHLQQALLMLPFGFSAFELEAEITLDGDPGHPAWAPGRPWVHLRALHERLPVTVDRIEITEDGALSTLVQYPPGMCARDGVIVMGSGGPRDLQPRRIDVDRLVLYTHQKEGANWYGKSVLRTAYKDFLIKDLMVRVNAQAGERNSMGIPVIDVDETERGSHYADGKRIVRDLRAGSEAGVVLPPGMRLTIQGVQGQVKDLIPTIKYHDQMMSHAVMAMFLDLGHDAGARSLGDSFVAVFKRNCQAIAAQIGGVFTQHVIRELVRWNYGPDEPYPRLTCNGISPEGELTVEGLGNLLTSGAIKYDEPTERWARSRFGLPEADFNDPARTQPAPTAPNQPGTGDPSTGPFPDAPDTPDSEAPYWQRINQPSTPTNENRYGLGVQDRAAARQAAEEYAHNLLTRVRNYPQ